MRQDSSPRQRREHLRRREPLEPRQRREQHCQAKTATQKRRAASPADKTMCRNPQCDGMIFTNRFKNKAIYCRDCGTRFVKEGEQEGDAEHIDLGLQAVPKRKLQAAGQGGKQGSPQRGRL